MSKLIVLSNRVNLPTPEGHSAGGLAVALQDALSDIGGVWLGWNGEQIQNQQDQYFNCTEINGIEYITCPLTEQQYQQYYSGFANTTLWPAMHDRDDLMAFDPQEFQTYQNVNRLFAEQLHRIAREDDMIWVHDYHFLSVAKYCRDLGMKNRFGFFLHIPFADLNIWKQLPIAQQLIEHLSEFDVVGLQTEHDQQNCLDVMQYYVGGQIDADILKLSERELKVQCYPIGVNPDLIQQVAQTHDNELENSVFKFDELSNQKTIIAVDRIDYSKGLIERFNAYAEFLNQHPEYHELVTDLQIACPCRMEIPAYEDLYKRVQAKVNSINLKYAQNEWAPINCVHETVQHAQLMQIYRRADICWVNSLRDGMNLVAKEFIAAQDPSDPGVLILSKYAGSAEQMPEAIIVDPESKSSMISALKQAIQMNKVERIERYRHLIRGIKHFDINDWRNAFLKDLKHFNSSLLQRTPIKQATVYRPLVT